MSNVWVRVNNELGGMGKEEVVAQYMIHLAFALRRYGNYGEDHSHENRLSGRDPKRVLSKYVRSFTG
jgi:hypothetical protein